MTSLRLLGIAPLLVDSIGYAIVVPVLASALIGLPPQMMAEHPAGTRYVTYGVAIGLYELACCSPRRCSERFPMGSAAGGS